MEFELERLLRNASPQDIENEVLRVASLISKPNITRKNFDSLAKISSSGLMHKYKLTWNEILEKFGLKERYTGITVSDKMKNQLARNYSDEDILEEISRVAAKLEVTSLSQQEFNQNSEISATVVCRRFGNWKIGLEKVGLSPKWVSLSKIDYFENLLAVWTFYGRQPKYKDMDSPPSAIAGRSYEAKFGKWSNALVSFVEYANSDAALPCQVRRF